MICWEAAFANVIVMKSLAKLFLDSEEKKTVALYRGEKKSLLDIFFSSQVYS